MLQREAHRGSQWELNLNERIANPGLQKLAYGRFPLTRFFGLLFIIRINPW
ncbi:Uncharacterised protein [Mycobacteroides abscessus]|uniref:Uncharacterized protein n=1 Tax=Mycobacteroides abscessus subsp. abscessus TaxID=1185650 RepID=A0AB38D383_9MYCO|nr:hypothetical protein [Mycobacteroides abscessus]SHP16295.1 Uncharacterised protein [Mycobacteroides abscessus subsp. abscessus]SLG73790.1 Uncharacterised protein [Mycobacteroides abscessus subsp. massiliense]MBE5436575.1 hypothetical protein [Mycobacteroides abscessus]CPR78831.1 Uncharacterised protein [Mycobacteroides abscessus]